MKSTLFAIFLALGFSSALAGSYTVQPKDTLYSIAKKFNSSIAELQKLNNLSVNSVNVGQVLIVPDPQQVHVVAAKETLFSIAKRYGVTVKAMLEANKLSAPELKIGQRLVIPNSSVSQPTVQTTGSSAKPNPNTAVQAQTSSAGVKPSASLPPKLPILNTAPKPQISNSSSAPKPAPATTPKPNISTNKPPPPEVVQTVPNKPETLPKDVKPNPANTTPASSSSGNSSPDSTPAPISSSSLPARPTSVSSLKPPATGNVKPATSSANTAAVLPRGRGTDEFIVVPVLKTAPLPNLSTPPSLPLSPDLVTDTTSSNTSQTLPEASTDTPELIHTVVTGETLYRIALRYNVSLESIRATNNLSSDAISAGQQIKIPVLNTSAVSPSSTGSSASSVSSVREVSQRYLGVTYRYGGTSPNAGLDCSGFVQIVFAELGLKLPRTSALQFQAGIEIAREDLTEGDLVFFDTTGRGVSHVGIYLTDNQFIHAASNPGKVTISSLTEKYWQPKYLGARRVMTDD